jgi:hypothetical protein
LITGFNTDIEHDGVTYHVQTEDKGLETPLLLSLVYTGGEILASKRVRYDDLIASGFDEKILADRLQRQHKLICAAIRAGRLDELKKMSERESASRSAARKEAASPAPLPVEPLPSEPLPPEPEPLPLETSVPDYPDEPHPIVLSPSQPLELPTPPPDLPPPAPAVSIPAMLKKSSSRRPSAGRTSKRLPPPPAQDAPTPSRPLPVAVPDFAYGEAMANEALRLTLIDEKNYRGGDHLILRAHVAQGTEAREPVTGAEVIVKILGSTFRPLILQSQTGPDGIAIFSIQLPHFRSGRAAILIRATSGGHEAEVRRIIQQG